MMAKKSAALLAGTMLQWRFEEMSESNDRDIVANALSPIGALANFLRELMQNVLDSGSKVLRFRFIGLPDGAVEAGRIDEIAERSTTARGQQFTVPADLHDDQYALLVEDEGCGLGGEWKRAAGPSEKMGGLGSFARGIGNSSKGAGDSGSKGVGRYAYYSISSLSTMYVHTKRAEDGLDLLFGMSNLDHHTYRGVNYRTTGLMFADAGAGRMPAEGELARSVARKLGIERAEGVSGTSILIPALRDDVRFKDVVKALLKDHFFPIIAGMIRVELFALGSDEAFVIDAGNICERAADDRFGIDDQHATLIRNTLRAWNAKDEPNLDLDFPQHPIRDGFIEGELLEEAVAAFAENEVYAATASFLVRRRTTGEEGTGRVTYCISSDPNLTCGADIKVRDGISVVTPLPGRPFVVMTISGRAFDPTAGAGNVDRVAEMLRDGENASHNQWHIVRMVEKGWAPDSAKLVHDCFKNGGPALLNTLNRRTVENDSTVLADLLSIPSDESKAGPSASEGKQARKTRAPKERVGNDNEDESETPFETFDVLEDRDGNWGIGVALKSAKRARGRPTRMTAVISYFYASLTAAAKSRKHTLADFDLRDERFTVEAVNCDRFERDAKSIIVHGPKPGFRLSLKGPFDPSREVEAVLAALAKSATAKSA
jgi:hypothetical protein